VKIITTFKNACFLFLVLATLSACAQSKHDISPTDFATAIDSNFDNITLLDVRTPDENENRRIKGAINIDINDSDFETKISTLDSNKTVYVYCLSGGRSGKAANILEKKGFKVYNLSGGISAWLSDGLPVEQGSPKKN
jgi:thioredoxin 1